MANEQVNTPSSPVSPGPSRSIKPRLVIVGSLILAAMVGGYFILRSTSPNGLAQNTDEKKPPSPYFRGWDKPKPDLVIILSGQMYGYVGPCGCSRPQVGGLARRYNFLDSLKAKGWPLMAVDLGDIAADHGAQSMLKYELSMKALDLMGYRAIGLGKREFLMPLNDALGEYSLNSPTPIPLAANLKGTEPGGAYYKMNVRQYDISQSAGFKIGVVGTVSQRIANEVTAQLKTIEFNDNATVLPKILTEFNKERVDLTILLCQGDELGPDKSREKSESFKCAEFIEKARQGNNKIAPVHLLVCLSDQSDTEGPHSYYVDPKFPNTRIIALGVKGRHVGVVGVWKTAKGIELKYDKVPIEEEFAPKAGQKNPVLDLEEEYTLHLKKNVKQFLVDAPRTKHEIQIKKKGAFFVGSEECGKCHDHAFSVWSTSQHAHAFDALVNAKLPSNRQYDAECIVCHTVGFKYESGYYDSRKKDPKEEKEHNEKLLHVGCENCHGPGSAHVNNPRNLNVRALMNPLKGHAKKLSQQLNDSCQKCHDSENDVHWGQGAHSFDKQWEKVAHPTPEAERQKLKRKFPDQK